MRQRGQVVGSLVKKRVEFNNFEFEFCKKKLAHSFTLSSAIDDIRVMVVYICDVDIGSVLHHGRIIICRHCWACPSLPLLTLLQTFLS